jgi:hypothetical protein
LGGDHGTLVQFDKRYRVGSVAVVSGGGFIDGGVGIHFALAAKGIEFFGFIATVWAYVTRRENFIIAMGTDFTDQPIALFLKSPMSWNFHRLVPFSKPNSM